MLGCVIGAGGMSLVIGMWFGQWMHVSVESFGAGIAAALILALILRLILRKQDRDSDQTQT